MIHNAHHKVESAESAESLEAKRRRFKKLFAEVAARFQESQPSNPKSAVKPHRKEKSTPEEPATPSPTLEECARQVALNHKAALEFEAHSLEHGKKAIQFAVKAGASLRAAKGMLNHGEWLPWLKENVPNLSGESAQRYMRLEKASHVQDLSECETLRQAYLACGIIKPPKPNPPSEPQSGKPTESDEPDGSADGNANGSPANGKPSGLEKVFNSVDRLIPHITLIDVKSAEAVKFDKAIRPIIDWHEEYEKHRVEREEALKEAREKDHEWMIPLQTKFPIQEKQKKAA